MANSDSVFSELELYGGEGYVPYESKDPLNDPKSFTFRYKVINYGLIFVCYLRSYFWIFWKNIIILPELDQLYLTNMNLHI